MYRGAFQRWLSLGETHQSFWCDAAYLAGVINPLQFFHGLMITEFNTNKLIPFCFACFFSFFIWQHVLQFQCHNLPFYGITCNGTTWKTLKWKWKCTQFPFAFFFLSLKRWWGGWGTVLFKHLVLINCIFLRTKVRPLVKSRPVSLVLPLTLSGDTLSSVHLALNRRSEWVWTVGPQWYLWVLPRGIRQCMIGARWGADI